MRNSIIVLLITFGLISTNVHAALKVVTTTQDLAALAQAIGGGHVEVYSFTPGTRDPHFAEAKPSMIRRAFKADALLLIGAELEVGWLPAILRSSRNRNIQPGSPGYLDLSHHVELLGVPRGEVSRSMGDVHAAGNPHYWLNPENGIRMARAIAKQFSELDADHGKEYQAALDAFEKRMTQGLTDWKKRLAHLKGQKLIAYHTSLLYLADAFGFSIVKEVEPKPGIAPGAAYLSELVNFIKQENIRWLIMESYYETRSAKFLERNAGVKAISLPQSVGSGAAIKSYFDLFEGIVSAFERVK